MTAPASGHPLDLHQLWAPELADLRHRVIDDLISVSREDPDSLGAPKGARTQVEANVDLWSAPTAAAAEVFTGVLFAAVDFADLDPSAAALAQQSVRIASPLYGFLTPGDPIAAYRLPPTAKLPRVGAPLAHFAPAVSKILDDEDTPVVLDCRSGTYQRLWRPAVSWVNVRAVELRHGTPTVVSHFAKHHRGVLTRHLLTRGSRLPTTPQGVLHAAQELCGTHYRSVSLEGGSGGMKVLELTLI